MKIIKKCPIPIAPLILAMFATGNLFTKTAPAVRNVFGVLAGIFYVIFILKILTDFGSIKEEMQKPPVASVMPAITMATMLMATYLKPFIGNSAQIVWFAGVFGHIALLLWFSLKFLPKYNIKMVFPSWHVVYVGLACGSVTAPAFNMQSFGQIIFWITLVFAVILQPIVLYRVLKVKEMPPPTMPSTVIIAAPFSLLLAGYLQSFQPPNFILAAALYALASVFFLVGLGYLVSQIKNPFIPTMGAFTFPMAISAVAAKGFAGFIAKAGFDASILGLLANIEVVIAVAITAFIYFKYVNFFLKTE